MRSNLTTTSNATILTVGEGDRSAVAAISSDLYASTSPVASQASAMVAAIGTFNERIAANAATLLPNARNDANRNAAASIMASPFQSLAAATVAEGRSIAAANAIALAYEPGNAPFRSQVRDRFIAMDAAGRAAFAQRADLEQTSALMEAGRDFFDNTPDAIWQIVEDRHILQRHIARSGLQSNYQRQPSAINPVDFGPDEDAAMTAAKVSLDALRARSGIIGAVRNTLQSIINAVALATDLSREDAYKLLSTRKAA